MKKNPLSLVWIKNSNWWKERNSIGTLLLFSLVFTGMGFFFLLDFSLIPLYQVVRSRSWTVTPAVVTESFAEPYGRGGRLCIHYEYVWGNRKRHGKIYDFFHSRRSYGGGSEREELIKSHPAGKRIECLVNPDDPAESVVSRSVPWTVWPPRCCRFYSSASGSPPAGQPCGISVRNSKIPEWRKKLNVPFSPR